MSKKTIKPASIFLLKEEDILTAAGVHARAFMDDPFTIYALQNEKRRLEQITFLLALTLRYAVIYGRVYATPNLEGVAAWIPPNSPRESIWRMLRVGALEALWRVGQRAIRSYMSIVKLTDRLHARYAPEPHWYLSQVGVEPNLQGQGVGQRLLTPTLEQIDQEQKAAYLETMNPKALPFYTKLDFKICEEVILPAGGPPMWVMRREPQQ